MKSENKPKLDVCFVIMPFQGWLDTYYEKIYTPAIQEAGFTPKRSDDLFGPSRIVQDIWDTINKSKVLVADLTGKNPNVMYELGLAHAIKKPVILTTENLDDVPFDLRSIRVIVYDKNHPDWGNVLKNDLIRALSEVTSNPSSYMLPNFNDGSNGTQDLKQLESEIKRDLVSQQQKIIDDLLDQKNLLSKNSRHLIGPSEATALIELYYGQGLPDELLINRIEKLGAPRNWIKSRLTDLKNKNKVKKQKRSSG